MAQKLITYWCIACTVFLPLVLCANAEFQRGVLIQQINELGSQHVLPNFVHFLASLPISLSYIGIGIAVLVIGVSLAGLKELKTRNSYFLLYVTAVVSISLSAMVALMPGSAFTWLNLIN